EGIMANYGTPVVRFTLKDGSYRYIDGYDRAAGRYVTAFDYSAGGFGGMYKYKDISYLVLKETGRHTEGGEIEGQAGSVTSTYSELTVNTAEEFESFARIINSAIPAVFKDENGETVTRSILDTLTISVKLGADIDLTQGDENGNASEFYGIGKQEFFPYRGGIDGDGHKIKVNIDAPNGYCIGVISVVSEMAEDIFVKNLTVEGSIKGKTKVGIVGYFDMVCNAYVKGGTLRYNNVKNYADISGFTAVGGLLGCVSADKDGIKTFVENCENNGDITLAPGGMYAGGIIGVAGFYASHGTGVQINGAANKGGITLGAGTKYAGGIAGMIYDNISSLENVSSTAAIAVSSAACTGNLLGYSGAVKMTATDGDIGKYAVSPAANVIAVTFRDAETVSDYGTSVTIKLNDANITPNYDLRLTFTDGNGDKYTFAEGKTERSKNALGSYTVIMEPGVYTMGITAYNGEEYYSDGQIEDGTVLAATASFTVNKKALNYTFNDVSVAYTGSPVTYFEALETLPGYDKTAHAIPDTSFDNGAAWEIKYYKDGIETGAPADFGVYDVTARLIANGKFSSRYEFEDRTYEVKMTVTKPLLTVTVNNVEINKGGKATFGVSVKTSDGSEFSDIASLRLVYRVKGYGTDDTSILPFGTYTVEANGSAPALYDVEYKTGTLIVKNVSQTSENNSGKKTKKGCKGDLGAVCSLGIAALAAAVALKRKK
ncbi:MAG: hypothetical protein J6Z34_03035, partial [Clostridia bacterium]|nr:hypothetical protein [Clostridia bacterium]